MSGRLDGRGDPRQRLPNAPGLTSAALPAAPRGGLEVGGAGRGLMDLSERVARLGEGLNRRADAEAEDQARLQGGVAGNDQPGAQMEGGGRVFRNAFNSAATESSLRRLEVDARGRLAELAETHADDPAAFTTAVQGYRDGLAGGLPGNLGLAVRVQIDRLAVPQVQELQARSRQRVRDEAVASFEAVLPGRVAEIEQQAQLAPSDPAALARLDVAQQALREDLARLGPRAAFTLDGVEYPADETRTGALTVTKMQEQITRIRRQEQEAMALGAWRAGGSSRSWIDEFERRQGDTRVTSRARPAGTGPAGTGPARTGPARTGSTATPEGLAAIRRTIFRAENPAGDARRTAAAAQDPSLTASGPGQITDGTWAEYAERLGLAPSQRNDRAAQERIFDAYMGDAQQRIGRPLTTGEAYAAWVLGIEGAAAFLAAPPDADALALYRRVAGDRLANQAFRSNGNLMRPGMTAGQVLDGLAGRVGQAPAATPPDGTPTDAAAALPLDDVRRIAARLRAELTRDEAATRQRQQEALTTLRPLLQQNSISLHQTGRIVHQVSDEQLAAAGMAPDDIRQHRAQERSGAIAWQAAEELRGASSPADLARIAAPFAPGGEMFAADPQGASRILDLARARGAQVGDAAMEARIANLRAQAEASGVAPPPITREEGAAAGLRPEQVDRINGAVGEAAARGRLAREAGAMSPEEQAQFRRDTPVEGDRAAENRDRLRIVEQAWRAQAEGLASDPAGYALQSSPAAQRLAAQLQEGMARGDLSALQPLVEMLKSEQARLGVAADRQQPLPKPMLEAMGQAVAQARDPATAAASLSVLASTVGLPRLLEALGGIQGTAAQTRREATAVAAAMLGRDPVLARQILAGAIFLRDNPVAGLSPQATEAAADGVLGNAFRAAPAARAQLLSAASAVYAADMAQRGQTGGAFDERRFQAALRQVQPMTRWDGQTLPLPPGITASAFGSTMGDLPPAALAGAMALDGRPITPAMVARGGFELVPVGSGLFELRYGGAQVVSANGGPFRLDMAAAQQMVTDRARAAQAAANTPAARRLPGIAPALAERAIERAVERDLRRGGMAPEE